MKAFPTEKCQKYFKLWRVGRTYRTGWGLEPRLICALPRRVGPERVGQGGNPRHFTKSTPMGPSPPLVFPCFSLPFPRATDRRVTV